MKVLLNYRFSDEKMKELEALGCELMYVPEPEMDGRDDYYDAEVWFTYKSFEDAELYKFKNLKLIILTSTGFDQVPRDFVVENNIVVVNNKLGYSIPIAESIVMYILEVYKNSYQAMKKQELKIWNMDMSWQEIAGKKVGFLGTGNISQCAAKRLQAFDVDIWGVNTNGRDVDYFSKCFPLSDSDEFFKECDVIVGVMPSTPGTDHVVDSERLDMMKEGAVLINVGRGNLIDLSALGVYIDKFKGVVLDVVEEEPLEPVSYLWDKENVIITPHNSWVYDNNWKRRYDNLYRNLKAYVETGKPVDIVKDINRGY